jgi:hypothetical protein
MEILMATREMADLVGERGLRAAEYDARLAH